MLAYAAILSLSALPAMDARRSTRLAHILFGGEIAFELGLSSLLVGWLYALFGRYLATPARQLEALLHLLSDLVDAREGVGATSGHARRVSAMSLALARAMGMPEASAEEVAYAALLHDLGKVGVPDDLLKKQGPLDVGERTVMMTHAALGARIVAGAGSLQRLAPLIRHHHEWWNGQGYPDGLAGPDIPLGAAVISVADALDAMTGGRPYRAPVSHGAALAEIRRSAGTQFAPEVVAALVALYPNAWDVAAGDAAPWTAGPPTLAEQAAQSEPAQDLRGAGG